MDALPAPVALVAPPEILLSSDICRVSLYGRGAVVVRRAVLPEGLPGGRARLVVRGVTRIAEVGSFRAALLGAGGARVERVRAARVLPETPPVPELSRRIEALLLEQGRLQQERRVITERMAQLLKARPLPKLRQRADAGARVVDALAAGALLDRLAAEAEARGRALAREAAEVERALEAARLEEWQREAWAKQQPPGYDVEIWVSGLPEAGAALELSYVVRAARWWPTYTLRIKRADGAGKPEGKLGMVARLQMDACVAQASEEAWRGAEVSLSTGDLHLDLRLPKLAALRFGRAQPPARPGWREAPAGLDRMFEGYDRLKQAERAAGHDRIARLPPEERPRGGSAPDEQTGAFAAVQEEAEAYGDLKADLSDKRAMRTEQDRQDLRREQDQERKKQAPPVSRGAAPMAAPAPKMEPQAPGRAMDMPYPSMTRSVAKRSGGFGAMVGGAVGAAGEMLGAAAGAVMDGLRLSDEEGGGGGDRGGGPIEPGDGWMDYDGLELAAVGEPGRGRLRRAGRETMARDAEAAAAAIEGVTVDLPDPWRGRGLFDASYVASARADIPSDGQPHRLQVAEGEGEAATQLRAVPRASPEVYRSVRFKNPVAGPLLAGPVEVWLEGSLLCRSALAPVERGGEIEVGLGVEDRVRCARNAQVQEEKAGLLGGSVSVTHTVHMEFRSSLGHLVPIEVVDRLPITEDRGLTVARLSATPEPEAWDQAAREAPIRGGLRWRLTLRPEHPQVIEYQYRLTFPARQEIIGGNRREG